MILPEDDNVKKWTIFTQWVFVFGIARRRFKCFFFKNDFGIAELSSFLLADCQGVKALFRFEFAKRMTFSVSNFVFSEDQLMLICFQMWFLNALKQSGRFTWNNKENSNVNYGRMKFSECVFLFKIARWTFTLFRNWYLGSRRLVISCWVNSEIWNRYRFEGTTIWKTNLVFGLLQRALDCFWNAVFGSPNLVHQLFIQVPRW